MQQRNDLRNKRVVILGGSSGIGLAVARQAASEGAKIVIASSNSERVQKAIDLLDGNAQGHTLDLSRVGEPADIAQAYLFLMQEAFSTGQTLVVDGGTVLV
jgi:NAD(P)-dependent dehydrogenase (short-subunit alcohol dehydrogenase family)